VTDPDELFALAPDDAPFDDEGDGTAKATGRGELDGEEPDDAAPTGRPDDPADVVRAIEAIVLVATDPVPPDLLAQLLELPVTTVEQLCQRLADAYDEAGHGFQLVRVAGGYRYQSHPDLAPYVERFVLEGQSARLSAAALETLAIVAYKQPISRAQVAAIRGVDPDAVLRTLQSRGYVDQVGRDPGPGQAVLWGTTPQFLERLGLDSVADLPPIADFVPGADVVEALEAGLRVEPVLIEDLDPTEEPTDDPAGDTAKRLADDPAEDLADDPDDPDDPDDTAGDRAGGPSEEGPSGDGA
jgi:segregation and condensation protein B